MASTTTIDRASLRVYLRDHHAASVAALRLLDRMCRARSATNFVPELVSLTREVRAEQAVLRTLLRSVGGNETGLAVTLAWLGEKVTRFKLGPGKPRDSGLILFETLEALTLAFYGRRALWQTLAGIQRVVPFGGGMDFDALAARADRHLVAMEEARRAASQCALCQDGAG